jgi:hypothetical protein
MTTHDHRTLTGSDEESQTADAGTPQVREETPQVREETPQVREDTTPVPPDPAPAGDAPVVSGGDAPVVSGERSNAERQSSTAELLFADDELAELRARWAGVQAAFVDDPKECIQKADVLVSDLVEQLTTGFADARSRLEEQWARGEETSTEDLRVALMHYRDFFDRLLAV